MQTGILSHKKQWTRITNQGESYDADETRWVVLLRSCANAWRGYVNRYSYAVDSRGDRDCSPVDIYQMPGALTYSNSAEALIITGSAFNFKIRCVGSLLLPEERERGKY